MMNAINKNTTGGWISSTHRYAVRVLCGALGALLLPLAVHAKPIELVVPIAPGGSTDALSRVLADELAKKWNEPVVVVNKPGAGVTVAARYVLEQPADGRTILVGTVVLSIIPHMKKVPFDYAAFAPITPIFNTASVLYVRASMPANTVKEFIEWGKNNPKGVSFGSTGIGSATHIDAEAFAAAAGIKMVHVPYNGTAATFPAMAGDHIDAAFGSPSSRSLIQKGSKVKALMLGSARPLPDWPELPVVDRALLGSYTAENWAGAFVLAKTPVAIQEKLNADINALYTLPSVLERFARYSIIPTGGSRDAFASAIANDRARIGALLKSRNLTVE